MMRNALPENLAQFTPMMRQYFELKKQSGDAILFFRMGDFYEIFGDEAEEIAPKLEITLTSRERGDKQRVPFCGVPHHSARTYWLKLLKLGYKIAIGDQVEDALAAKGLVKRAITKIMTPGCIDDLEGLESDRPNYIMGVYEKPETREWAVVLADISTGEMRVGTAKSEDEVKQVLELFKPKELLCRKFFLDSLKELLKDYCNLNPLMFGTLPENILGDKTEQQGLFKEVFPTYSLRGQERPEIKGVFELIAAVIGYFKSLKASVGQFSSIKPLKEPDCISLNEILIRDLEIFETSRTQQSNGSLFKQINECLSPMGSRLLRWSLVHPFLEKKQILARHDTISYFLDLGETFLVEMRAQLQGLGDIERLTTRVVGRLAKPLELARLRDSLLKTAELVALLKEGGKEFPLYLQEIMKGLDLCYKPILILAQAVQEQPQNLGVGDGVFSSGFDQELDQHISFFRNGQEKVDLYGERLKEETGIQSLKIKFHKTFGLVIEVTKSNLSKVPSHFFRRQTMVNCERFITDELKNLDENLASAKDRAIEREYELYQKLLADVEKYKKDLQEISNNLSKLDVSQSFSWLALHKDYCRPKIVSHNSAMDLQGCRHPVVEHFVGRHNFVPNHIMISAKKKQMLITGPNMAGKSTIMRQIALCAILNQIGGFVPAVAAKLPIFDGVYTRVGAADDLSKGLSTFMVEMSEAAYILRHASPKSLVILDEVGRGTSSEDGLAIASAILEYLAKKLQCWTMFATHYHELVKLAQDISIVETMQTEVLEKENGITFTHRLISGASGNSYGIEVAQLAGLPDLVLQQAKKYLNTNQTKDISNTVENGKIKGENQEQCLFDKDPESFEKEVDNPLYSELAHKLENVKIHRTTPLQALNILNELKAAFGESRGRSLFQDRQM